MTGAAKAGHGVRLAVSMGEPAGVGPDVVLRAHEILKRDAPTSDAPAPELLVFGDPDLFVRRGARLGVSFPIAACASAEDCAAAPDALRVIATGQAADRPGVLDPQTAPTTVAALQAAVEAVRAGACDGLVTAPIHKANLYRAGFSHPGHTEYLEAQARALWDTADARAIMMLAGPELRTVPVTVHIPLHRVPGALTAEAIVAAGRITARDLHERFGVSRPRLAVAGLNPHAGEAGTLGKEDDAVIAPAVQRLQADGIDAHGPLPADTLFHAEARATYDAALCMYHDQALIPVKALDFHNTVNVTLGLPFIRTSPDHGTALDLAGTGKASPASMIAAIHMAARMAERTAQQRDAA